MKKLPWVAVALCAIAGAANVFAGCGSETEIGDDTDAGSEDGSTDAFIDAILDGQRPDAEACLPSGASCVNAGDCCSANCIPFADGGAGSFCGNPVGLCKLPGTACTTGNECCTFSCVNGSCSNLQCVPDNGPCGQDGECCGGRCVPDGTGGGVCQPLNNQCKTSGNPCGGNGECCSGFCNGGLCNSAPSFCTQNGDICSTNFECCGGACNKPAGSAVGTCGVAPGGGTTGCDPTGTVCTPPGTIGPDGGACGGNCCSRSCLPYAATGFTICQPPSGCKPTGEVCRVDSDCCGWAGAADAGIQVMGPVTCSKASPTQEFGRCNNGGACREPGSICGQASDGTTCNAENSCCDPIGFPSSYCQAQATRANCCGKDALGIPRCLVKPVDCASGMPDAGTTCATSADCCGNPCIDNKCSPPGSCVPKGGMCSSNADCCPGTPCVIPPGASSGVCGGGSSAPPDSGAPCALYGQTCSVAADCCELDTLGAVPCHEGRCRFP